MSEEQEDMDILLTPFKLDETTIPSVRRRRAFNQYVMTRKKIRIAADIFGVAAVFCVQMI